MPKFPKATPTQRRAQRAATIKKLGIKNPVSSGMKKHLNGILAKQRKESPIPLTSEVRAKRRSRMAFEREKMRREDLQASYRHKMDELTTAHSLTGLLNIAKQYRKRLSQTSRNTIFQIWRDYQRRSDVNFVEGQKAILARIIIDARENSKRKTGKE